MRLLHRDQQREERRPEPPPQEPDRHQASPSSSTDSVHAHAASLNRSTSPPLRLLQHHWTSGLSGCDAQRATPALAPSATVAAGAGVATQQPAPVWRPTGVPGSHGAPQRRLPGWAARAKRLRAKLAGPAEAEESDGVAGDGGIASSGGREGSSPPSSPSPGHPTTVEPPGVSAHVGHGSPDSSPWAQQSYDIVAAAPLPPPPLQVQRLRLVAPHSSSRLFDDEPDEAGRRGAAALPPLRAAAPAASTSPSHVITRAPALVRVASSRLTLQQQQHQQLSSAKCPPVPAVTAPLSTFPTHGEASAPSMADVPPLRFRFDSPPAVESNGIVSRSRRVLAGPPTGSYDTLSGTLRGTGESRRVWSQGLAWLNNTAPDGEDGDAAAASPTASASHPRPPAVLRLSASPSQCEQPVGAWFEPSFCLGRRVPQCSHQSFAAESSPVICRAATSVCQGGRRRGPGVARCTRSPLLVFFFVHRCHLRTSSLNCGIACIRLLSLTTTSRPAAKETALRPQQQTRRRLALPSLFAGTPHLSMP